MSTLTLQTIGGLASRMRVILPAIGQAQRTGRRLKIRWPEYAPTLTEQGGKFLCPFEDLFLTEYGVYDIQDEAFRKQIDWKKNADGTELGIRTCHPEDLAPELLDKPLSQYWFDLTPAPPLQAMLDKAPEWPEDGTRRLVVHVRTQHAQKEACPLDWSLGLLQRIPLFDQQNTTLLICAEERAVSEAILRVWNGPTIEQQKTYRYDRDGILRSAVDLYLMAESEWIIGSVRSSYSQLGSWLQANGPQPEEWRDRRIEHDWRRWIFPPNYLDSEHPDRESDLLGFLRGRSGGVGGPADRSQAGGETGGDPR